MEDKSANASGVDDGYLPVENRTAYRSPSYAGVIIETWRDVRTFLWLTDNFPIERITEEGLKLSHRGNPGEIALALRTAIPDEVYRPTALERLERTVELSLRGVKVRLTPREFALIAAVKHFLSCIDRVETYEPQAQAYINVARMRAMSAGASGAFLDRLASKLDLVTGSYKPAMQDKRVWLKVRPEDFAKAREMGAQQDQKCGAWFVPPGEDVRRFSGFFA